MISVEGLSVEFNATPLFEDVSYVINKKDRIALVARMVQVNQQCLKKYWQVCNRDTWSSGYSKRCRDWIFAAGDDSRR